MATQKTPGVYVIEQSLFPPSVAEVATAIPAFIGYTEFARNNNGNSLKLIPTKVKSLLEYESYFGKGFIPGEYKVICDSSTPKNIVSVAPDARFYLYDSLRLFFDNGGGECYIVSVEVYTDTSTIPATINPINKTELISGVDALKKYDEPTLILFPDAVGIPDAIDINGINAKFSDLASLQTEALKQCAKLQDRFTIMDLMEDTTPLFDPIATFRDKVGMNNLSYGAAYYPWVKANFLPDIKWEQLIFYTTTLPHTTIDPDTAFATDDSYKLFKSKKDNWQTIFDKIDNLNGTNAAITTIDAYLSSLKKLVTESIAVKTNFTAYLRVLSDIAVFFPAIYEKAGDDLKKILEVIRNDAGLQGTIKKLIGIEKIPKMIEVRINSDISPHLDVYLPLFETAEDKKWVGGDTYDDIPEEVFNPELEDTDQLRVIDALIAAKIPEKLIETITRIFDEAKVLKENAEKSLMESHPFFKTAVDQIKNHMRLMPPSGAVAGIYASVDRIRGVWKAPANVSINSVIGPAVKIDNKDQEDMNVHTTGKSVNAIRAFTGKGTLVWGARTLAGNDNEWRYIPVRRFYNMVEESVKKATEPFTFEPNDKNTWVKVKAMIENFLTLQWRAGALQGAKTEDAFFVSVGLGETMTAQDILEGRMIVEIGMAVVRPAEFIILRFSHKMIEK
jgi:uncharacterized protein